jgi:hypothetical protein
MTTSTYSSVIAHTNDATFRTWVADLLAALDAMPDITRTADTGQINTATVTRPAVNTSAGYAMYRFNDALQATSPVFLRIDFGTAAAAGCPKMWATVGGSTNGAGVIGNTIFAYTGIGPNNSAAAAPVTTTNFPTYICTLPGYLFFSFKDQGYTSYWPLTVGILCLSRSHDATGANTGEGVVMMTRYAPNSNVVIGLFLYSYKYSVNRQYLGVNGTEIYTLIIGGVTSSLVAGVPQVYKCFYPMPEWRTYQYALQYLGPEFPTGVTFTENVAGVTRTYLPLDSMGASGPYRRTADKIAFVYE